MKGGRGLPWSPLPASESLPLTILIPPPQAKLNLSVRALESSAPDLQVANGRGRMGDGSEQVGTRGRQGSCFEIFALSCPIGR